MMMTKTDEEKKSQIHLTYPTSTVLTDCRLGRLGYPSRKLHQQHIPLIIIHHIKCVVHFLSQISDCVTMNRQYSLSLVLVLASLAKVQSFAPAARLCSTPVAADRVFGAVQPSATRVWMADAKEEAGKEEDSKDEEVEAKDESVEAEEESKDEEEDSEIKAIKDEIAELESTLCNNDIRCMK